MRTTVVLAPGAREREVALHEPLPTPDLPRPARRPLRLRGRGTGPGRGGGGSALIISTLRLDLVAGTAPLLLAEMEGPEALARSLGARVGAEWPPPLFDADALEWSLDQVRADPRFEAWGTRYLVLRESDAGGAEAVGISGYKGPPDGDGVVEIGYSVIPSYQRRGLATEAALALVEHAFGVDGVTCVVAHTLPHLEPSIGVLRKAGFEFDGEHEEEGQSVVRYTRTRP